MPRPFLNRHWLSDSRPESRWSASLFSRILDDILTVILRRDYVVVANSDVTLPLVKVYNIGIVELLGK